MTTTINGTTGITTPALTLTTPLAETSGGTGVTATSQVAQVVTSQTGTVATGTTILPVDNTIPQITEGDEYMNITITPTNVNSTLEIEVHAQFTNSAPNTMVGAIFRDTTANAIAAFMFTEQSTGSPVLFQMKHILTAGSLSPTTFRFRAGAGAAGTTTFNGAGGNQYLGGVSASSMTIREYLP